jgi:hypothetical protein
MLGEVIDKITPALSKSATSEDEHTFDAVDMGKLRLVSRQVVAKTRNKFITRHSTSRKHMLSHHGLQALMDINQHCFSACSYSKSSLVWSAQHYQIEEVIDSAHPGRG